MAVSPELMRYLWRGLDLVNFEVIQILPLNKRFAVIVMRDKRPNAFKRWCTEYAGSGHYFDTFEELQAYCRSRRWPLPELDADVSNL